MKKISAFMMVVFLAVPLFANTTAIFPMEGVNIDKSFEDAFGALFANKYEKISGAQVIPPVKACKAITSDSSLKIAANHLGADEYIEISAIGLYLSNKEKNQVVVDSSTHEKIVIVNKTDIEEKKSDDDQDKLDNNKTIVTVKRYDKNGVQLYKTEMTLITYGDIEESTERMALSIYNKIPVEKTRTATNITRREGLGHNKLFVDKVKGFKTGMIYAVASDTSFSPIMLIAFDYRLESDKFFLELGAGGRIPSELVESENERYGGNYFELGGSYYFVNGISGVYAGGGLIPYWDWMNELKMKMAVYVQAGIEFPKNSRTRFHIDMRIAQNVLPYESTNYSSTYDYTNGYSYTPAKKKYYPTEIGLELGIGW